MPDWLRNEWLIAFASQIFGGIVVGLVMLPIEQSESRPYGRQGESLDSPGTRFSSYVISLLVLASILGGLGCIKFPGIHSQSLLLLSPAFLLVQRYLPPLIMAASLWTVSRDRTPYKSFNACWRETRDRLDAGTWLIMLLAALSIVLYYLSKSRFAKPSAVASDQMDRLWMWYLLGTGGLYALLFLYWFLIKRFPFDRKAPIRFRDQDRIVREGWTLTFNEMALSPKGYLGVEFTLERSRERSNRSLDFFGCRFIDQEGHPYGLRRRFPKVFCLGRTRNVYLHFDPPPLDQNLVFECPGFAEKIKISKSSPEMTEFAQCCHDLDAWKDLHYQLHLLQTTFATCLEDLDTLANMPEDSDKQECEAEIKKTKTRWDACRIERENVMCLDESTHWLNTIYNSKTSEKTHLNRTLPELSTQIENTFLIGDYTERGRLKLVELLKGFEFERNYLLRQADAELHRIVKEMKQMQEFEV